MENKAELHISNRPRLVLRGGEFRSLSIEQYEGLLKALEDHETRFIDIAGTMYNVNEIAYVTAPVYFQNSVTDLGTGITTIGDYKKLT